MSATLLKIEVPDVGEVSGLWQSPAQSSACLALAHGAGAGMTHRSMVAIADGFEGLGVATLRYQLPYMEKGRKRPDSPAVAHATVGRRSPKREREPLVCPCLLAAVRSAAG
jgi:predicted alpha/beta-hydrolase family hydrolase